MNSFTLNRLKMILWTFSTFCVVFKPRPGILNHLRLFCYFGIKLFIIILELSHQQKPDLWLIYDRCLYQMCLESLYKSILNSNAFHSNINAVELWGFWFHAHLARFQANRVLAELWPLKYPCSAETGHFTRVLWTDKSISPLWLQMTGAKIGVQLSGKLVTLRGHLCCAFCPKVLHLYFCFKTEVLQLVWATTTVRIYVPIHN